jgi:hypothetical protein
MKTEINHTRLVSELTTQDRRESTQKGYNPYALGIVLNAAADIKTVDDFCEAFNATRGMHRVAKALGLPLDVEKGRWVRWGLSE